MTTYGKVNATVATGAQTSTTAGGNGEFEISGTGNIKHIDCTLTTAGSGPCRAALALRYLQANVVTHLKTKWIRAGTGQPESEACRWDGEIPLKENMAVLISIRNDSGSEVAWEANWVIE